MDNHSGEGFYLSCAPFLPVNVGMQFIYFFHLIVAAVKVTFVFNFSFFTFHEFAGCISAALCIV